MSLPQMVEQSPNPISSSIGGGGESSKAPTEPRQSNFKGAMDMAKGLTGGGEAAAAGEGAATAGGLAELAPLALFAL